MKRLTIALLVLFAVPSTAPAATLNEIPFTALPHREAAGCLRPTGMPGGLTLFGRPAFADLWPGGASGERVRLGRLAECAAAAEAGGAGVVAGVVSDEVRAAVRESGGAFTAPVRVSAGPQPQGVSVAVSPSGHAAVAWTERRGTRLDSRPRRRGGGSPPSGTGPWPPVTAAPR